MHPTLRPFAERLGVSTESALGDFYDKIGNALASVESERRRERHLKNLDVIFETTADFAHNYFWPDPRYMCEPSILAIIIQSIPGTDFYKNPQAAREYVGGKWAPNRVLIGSAMEELIKEGHFECFLCRERGRVLSCTKQHCTPVANQHSTRHAGYGSDWFLRTTYGWQTALCSGCLRSVCDEYEDIDAEKEFKSIAATMRRIGKVKRKRATNRR